jgi:hypothetical protein
MKRRNRRHLDWIRTLPCCVPGCQRPCIPHHVRTAANSGTALKPPDTETVPLCHEHHQELHDKGRITFQRKHAVDLAEIAAWCAAASGTEMP